MKIVLICVGLLCSIFHSTRKNETSKENILTAHVWEIRIHSMTGIGIHKSIPKGTTIEFLNDKTWRSSAPIENFKTGKWSFENEARTLTMVFSNSEREFQIQELTTDKLRYRLNKFGAVYTYEWVIKK
jgi:hypothetical protein